MTTITVNFKKLRPDARMPTKATDGSAAFDLYALHAVEPWKSVTTAADRAWSSIVGPSPSSRRALIGTGISISIPNGYVGLVCSRSGLAIKSGVSVLNSPGIIDNDYRGEVCVIIQDQSGGDFEISVGDRIAQLLIVPTPYVELVEVAELPETYRGFGGFGSTGT